jgi:hypothetical protein
VKSTIIWILFSILIVTSSCSRQKDSEKTRWNEFYVRLLFIESGAFTLHGSKPITGIILDHRPKEEKDKERADLLSKMLEEERPAIKSEKKIDYDPKYDFSESWRLWEKNLQKDKINNYIIAHFPTKTSDLDFIYIVNIVEAATIIKKHYSLFKNYVGFDFDPLEMVFEIYNENSVFWNKLLNNEKTIPESVCLLGILFGYGIENSYPYSLLFDDERTGLSKKITSNLYKQVIKNQYPVKVKKFSEKDFPIPGFKTFSTWKPQCIRYEKEKSEIMNIYRKKELEKEALKKLYE